MGSIQRVNKSYSGLLVDAVFPCFVVAGGGNVPGLPFWEDRVVTCVHPCKYIPYT